MRQRLFGHESLEVADSLNAWRLILDQRHDFSNATVVARQVVEIRRKLLPKDHPLVAHAVYVLGYSLSCEGKWTETESQVREALAIRLKVFGDEHPDVAVCRSLLGTLLVNQGKPTEAEREFRTSFQIQRKFPIDQSVFAYTLEGLVELLPSESKLQEAEQIISDVLTAKQDNPANRSYLFSKRAECFARQGKWKEAESDAKVAVESAPSDPTYYHTLAPLLVACGDSNVYYACCQTIVARFGDTTNFNVADRMAKDCLCAPSPGLDLKVIGELATLAVTRGTNDVAFAFFQACKAMAEYRQDHYEGTIKWARAASQVSFPYSQAEAYATLAMGQYKLKQTKESQLALAKCAEFVETQMPKIETGDLGGDWRDWIIAHALLKEARNLIEGATPSGD
jgi:tetratricopeptide (TPR) repeat protein